MKRNLIAATALALVIGGTGQAAAPGQWYYQVTLNYVYAGQIGNRVAISVSPPINSGSCPGGGELILDQSNPYAKSMLAVILTAYTTTKVISVYTDGTCANNGVLLTDVRLP